MKDHVIDYSLGNALRKTWKWKIWILASCAIAGAITLFFAFRMPDEFSSRAAFVSPSFGSLSSMVFNNGIGYRGFESAEEIDIDRTVAYLKSIQLTDSVAKKFDLYAHYGIDPKKKDAEKLFYYIYSKNVQIQYTDRSTIEIETYDVDPKIASDIANTYLEFASAFFETISERKRGFQATADKLNEMVTERKQLLDSLAWMRNKYKIYHLDNMGDNVDRFLAAQMQANPEFHSAYDKVVVLEVKLKYLEERISDLEREYTGRKINLDQYPKLIQVIEEAKPSSFKARPKRSIFLLAAVAATFLFSVFVVLLVDRKSSE